MRMSRALVRAAENSSPSSDRRRSEAVEGRKRQEALAARTGMARAAAVSVTVLRAPARVHCAPDWETRTAGSPVAGFGAWARAATKARRTAKAKRGRGI